MPASLLAAVRQHAGSVGLNLLGLVDAKRFDASAPKEARATTVAPRCGTVLVIGTGGRSCAQQFDLQRQFDLPTGAGVPTGGSVPADERAIDRFVLDGVHRIEHLLRARSIPCR